MISYSIKSYSFVNASYVKVLLYLLLYSFALCQWFGFVWCCLRQLLWKQFNMQTNKQDSDPLYENFVLIFCSLQALTFNLCSGFSCPTSFSLIFFNPHLLHFLRGCERMLWSSRFLNCFRIIYGIFQAISNFFEILVTIPMINMFWF